MVMETIRVNSERFLATFEALSAIGSTPGGGVHRPALSPAHLESRRWFLAQAERAGLEIRVDEAGNHSALLRCGPADGPTVLLGSHLDSVPYGGRFDGALGVAAALEVLQAVRERGLSLNAHLEAIDFTDEEGFFVGLLGSMALAGLLEPEHLRCPRGGEAGFRAALRRAGLVQERLSAASRDPASLLAYLELHIEQGLRLLDQGAQIGIVSSIVGIRSHRVRFLGRADHAGTTPMESRLDAALGASSFTLAARDLVMARFLGGVANVGHMAFDPGAFNVVPETVSVALEFRAGDADTLDDMEIALLEQASLEAGRFGLGLEIEPLDSVAPVLMHERLQRAFVCACDRLGLKHVSLPSGAGHDAMSMVHVCPTGMIFVPSVGGASHSSREFTAWDDCVNGANTLLHAALLLAQQGDA